MCALTQGVIRRLGNTRVSLAWEEHQAPILTELCRKMARSGYEAGYRSECRVWGEQLKLTKPAMEEANQWLQYEILSKLVVGEMFDSGVEEVLMAKVLYTFLLVVRTVFLKAWPWTGSRTVQHSVAR